MFKTLLILVAVAGLVAAGVVEGMRTNRWGESDEVAQGAARLSAIPAAFGDWTSTDREMDPQVQRIAGAVGYIDRNYRNAKTGEVVDVLILSGPSGSIAAHTPDICFRGSGYAMKEATPVKRGLSAPGSSFVSLWSAQFDKETPGGGSPLLVNWAWGVNGDWSASEAPRKDYMWNQSLYKLYVTRRVGATDNSASQATDAINTFLVEFLPVVKTALASPSS